MAEIVIDIIKEHASGEKGELSCKTIKAWDFVGFAKADNDNNKDSFDGIRDRGGGRFVIILQI